MPNDIPTPFSRFAPPLRAAGPHRAAITAATRPPEPVCVPELLAAANLPAETAQAAAATARALVERLRGRRRNGGIQALVQEYGLDSQEGVALMCLAEALLRIPDAKTRDALIRDKVAGGDWLAHVGGGRPLFVNAAAWGLAVTGRLAGRVDEQGLASALTRTAARLGEPLIRRAVDLAMRMMGEQFVTGQTIDEALIRSRAREARGFAFSYDMLGEAAITEADAGRYYADYEHAIHEIGRAAAGRGPVLGPGISIKLSALHPRYARSQAARVMAELLPRVRALAALARGYDIGFNIDAEESDRLELSLDLLQSLAEDPASEGWDGLGFVVQAYSKRCLPVIDFLIDLARSTGRRLMIRLVKGAYWDAEIKRAQVEGLLDFPVYTRKIYTDVAYVACARRLLDAQDAVFPQFATHNAQTLATIYRMAGPDFSIGDYEFQCLHGMGEPLYEEVVGSGGLNRPCRVYAPVGTHETLLAYLVRRLLENGANSSFINRIADADVTLEELIADPVAIVRAMHVPGAPHAAILLPSELYGQRRNSAGLDLSDEATLATLTCALVDASLTRWTAGPPNGNAKPVHNPADHRDVVGQVAEAGEDEARDATRRADAAWGQWRAVPVRERAARLERAADLLQTRMPALVGLLVREAGKSGANAVAEVREGIDFLRYYASEAQRTMNADVQPLGVVVCISPWNFPLAIFIGQVAAALVAGNAVLAKPAEETPLIAAEAVRILHEAGVPADAVQLVPGRGSVGVALVGAKKTAAVLFTGSTEVAGRIQRQLAGRVSTEGRPIPLIAETGGQNAMIVDSSALAEQVVVDVIASAFDSAGQRCSALRLLCLQEEIADRTLAMLKGAVGELRVGRTDRLAVDVGPVITAEAKDRIERHIAGKRAAGRAVHQGQLPEECRHGTFVVPTIIEIDDMEELGSEVFGPVLHVLRYRSEGLDALVSSINATGYGLSFGLHTRIDETVARVTTAIAAGNIYVNRNIIGAVVGVQPFGGRGLSGTGPKAGGPLYLSRLVVNAQAVTTKIRAADNPALSAYIDWLDAQGDAPTGAIVRKLALRSRLGQIDEMPGPAGERNVYAIRSRGRVALAARSATGLRIQFGAVLATGNDAAISHLEADALASLPGDLAKRVILVDDAFACDGIAAALVEGGAADAASASRVLANRTGPIVSLQSVLPEALAAGNVTYLLDLLLDEICTSINTTAAGGNASLMAIV